MTLTESIVADASLTWFGELGYAVGHGPQMAPGEPAAEREPERSVDSRRQSFGEVVQSRFARTLTRPLPPAIFAPLRFPWGEERYEALRQLKPAIPPSRTLPTLRDTLLPTLRNGEIGVGEITAAL